MEKRLCEPLAGIGWEDRELSSDQLQRGATRVLEVIAQQKEIADKIGVDYDLRLAPSQRDGAVVCSRFNPTATLVLTRHIPPGDDPWSGWFVGCADDDHDHEADEYEPMRLFRLVEYRPDVSAYLALPFGSSVRVRTDGTFDVLA